MTTEYWLQKKTLGGWSHVTSYTDLEQAKRNFANCVGNSLSGYSWRLLETKTIEEVLLNDVVDVEPVLAETPAGIKGWSKTGGHWGDHSGVAKPVQDKPKSSWGSQPASTAPNRTSINPGENTGLSSAKEHGLTGSVWVINHSIPKKSRVPASELDKYLAMGYKKCGPRTQFE